jgi:hypothetical protein
MSRSGRNQRRPLLREGRTLLCYLGERSPRPVQLRHYARVLNTDEPLHLPTLLHKYPSLVRLVEPVGGGGRLGARLYLATILLEVSPEGARRLYDYEGRSRVGAVLSAALVLLVESVTLPLRLLLGRYWRSRA